ncbi:CBS domain-containing protein CBSX1, chloroplastic-like [Momordica charantia]|uniref:CBS domain-containing protein CBSX1, chloroplastic-like n=1 Tax=Momordica charantia TaxID=3673 RepID=A0A6J1DN09_MOMCH|nr:CBS domain-containing protein CBSX1, chloroplastic-like [Momordica charantia]
MASISTPYVPPALLPNSRPLQRRFRSSAAFSPSSNRSPSVVSALSGHRIANSAPSRSGSYTVGDFMTKKGNLQVVKPSTTIDEALEVLVENKLSGFPVVDGDWKLVGVVSDYDLLAVDSISGVGGGDWETNIFPDVNISWKSFKEIQKLVSKTNGEVIGDLMTPAPLVVRETTDLENAARLLLETKFHSLPVVDCDGKLVGNITREDIVKAGLQIMKRTQT